MEFRHNCPAAATSCDLVRASTRAHCVIRLYDAWSRFCRLVVIVSAGARPVTVASGRVGRAPGISSVTDVLPTLRALHPKVPPGWEPRWGRAADCLAAARDLRIGNFPTVSAAIGVTPSPAEDLRIVRNFYAHRGEVTVSQARGVAVRVGMSGKSHPDHIPVFLARGGLPVYELWIVDLMEVAEASVQ